MDARGCYCPLCGDAQLKVEARLMRMRLLARMVLIALLLCSVAAPAIAQSGAPDTVRSSTLTRAQADELNRRLATLEQRFAALARETDLREGAVRNIAIEIFGADPNLDFETYVALIDNGARELRTYLTDARARTDPDPAAAAIRQRAIAASEDGRLTEARALYDQLIAANRSARQRARDAEDLADAADMAEAARLAFVSADYRDAARRYGAAAELAPASGQVRWGYRMLQANALRVRGDLFREPETLREAVRIFEGLALPLVSRTSSPTSWATTQNDLGDALRVLSELGDVTASGRAIAAHRAALEVRTRGATPTAWADSQVNLGNALLVLGVRGDQNALLEAVASYRAALEVYTRANAAERWATVQNNLGIALRSQAERGNQTALLEALAAHRAALEVRTRAATPADWADSQVNLGTALLVLGAQGNQDALREAVSAYRAALEVHTRSVAPGRWATAQNNLGITLQILGELGDGAALRESVRVLLEVLQVRDRERNPAEWAQTQHALGRAYRTNVLRGEDSYLPAALDALRLALAGYEEVGNSFRAEEVRRFLAELDAQPRGRPPSKSLRPF
jgi:tetratricopeptide (TPR) repeat protein